MATTKEYKEYILEVLSTADGVTVRPMMGEYLLYSNGVLFGGIYDNRLLIKMTKTNEKYGMAQEIPYDGAKPMYFAEDTDDVEKLKKIIADTCAGLPKKRK